MLLVTRIYSFGTISNEEIIIKLKITYSFENRNTFIFSYSGYTVLSYITISPAFKTEPTVSLAFINGVRYRPVIFISRSWDRYYKYITILKVGNLLAYLK
jgi:hypothetical protein